MPITLTEKKNKMAEIPKRLNTLANRSVHVGVTGPKGAKPHSNAEVPVATLAMFHEFGTATVEKRSFVRAVIDDRKKEIGDRMLKVAANAIIGRSVDNGLSKLGKDVAKAMEFRILAGIAPPLSPFTVQAKGHALILREIDQLIESLGRTVVKRG